MIVAIIACSLLGTACGNGGADRDAYIGMYKFVSMSTIMIRNGERNEMTVGIGENGFTEDSITLEIKEDGTYIASVTAYGDDATMTGLWTVSKGMIELSDELGSSGFNRGRLIDGILKFTASLNSTVNGDSIQTTSELNMKKVTTETVPNSFRSV